MSFKATFLLMIAALNLYANSYQELLLHGNCTTCHFESKAISAPSIIELKQKYLEAFQIKEEFIEYMAKWVKDPKKETSIMQEAIDKYGLMPELGFDLETLREISEYIYETDFKQEDK